MYQKAFCSFLSQNEALLLAHHEADQAETILLRLFRGSGPLGLGGIQKKAKLGKGDLVRPLLEVPKENVSDPNEWLKRKKRIQFYSNLGVKVLKGVNYLLPLQVDGDVEEMYLMIKLSKNVTSIPRKSIADFINSVYTDVYDYRKTDLLRRTITNLPDVIDIKGLKVRDL